MILNRSRLQGLTAANRIRPRQGYRLLRQCGLLLLREFELGPIGFARTVIGCATREAQVHRVETGLELQLLLAEELCRQLLPPVCQLATVLLRNHLRAITHKQE